MPTYVAFLRAINLGKTRKFPMAELQALLEAEGYTDVETYIHTGNVRLRSTMRSTTKVGVELERLFEADRGFVVRTIVLTPRELREVYDDAMRIDPPIEADRRYVTLLQEPAPASAIAELESRSNEAEAARVRGRAVHLWMRDGYQNTKLDNARIEKTGGHATTRDLKVITTLAERWGR